MLVFGEIRIWKQEFSKVSYLCAEELTILEIPLLQGMHYGGECHCVETQYGITTAINSHC